MPCNCTKPKSEPSAGGISPRSPCLYCAEKHLSTAAALAREQGYAGENRGYVIGELVAACWHLDKNEPGAALLSDRLRSFRHRIQTREEDETATDFTPYLLAIDLLIRQQEHPSTNEGTL